MVQQRAGGRIVNVTSVHGHVPKSGSSAYRAAKGGLGRLTKVMALELAEHNITVNAVAPGGMLLMAAEANALVRSGDLT